ncbi:MAG: thioredoxin family protein [Bacilli bacterium]|nr:thioredoxin family protein [Bacilli bacterium]
MIYLDNDNLKDVVSSGRFLVDFYATWCGPCKMLESVLEGLEDKINIVKVDIDKFPNLASEYRVMSVPTLIFFVDGEKKEEVIGYHDEDELLEVIAKL